MIIEGSGFANDLNVPTLTTTAAGVTFSNVHFAGWGSYRHVDFTATATASAALGFYPVTYTDDNGTATLANAFGVDPGVTLTSVSPNTAPLMTDNVSVTLTGSNFVSGGHVQMVAPDGTPFTGTPAITGVSVSADETSVSFSLDTYYLSSASEDDFAGAGTYQIRWVNGDGSSSAFSTFTVTGPSLSTASELTSTALGTYTLTLTGAGFSAGAQVDVSGSGCTDVSAGTPTSVTSTQIKVPVTLATGYTGDHQCDVTVRNTDGTWDEWFGVVGIGEAGYQLSSSLTDFTVVSSNLDAGTTSSVLVTTDNFNQTVGATASFSGNGTSFTGVVSQVSGSDVTITATPPRYVTTTTTQAAAAGATTLYVNEVGSLSPGSYITVVAGANSGVYLVDTVHANSGSSGQGYITLNNGLGAALASGGTIQTDLPSGHYNMTLTSGGNSITHAVWVDFSDDQYKSNGADLNSEINNYAHAGLGAAFTINAKLNGFNFGTGSSVSFADDNGVSYGVTGTVTNTSSSTANIAVTVPSSVTLPLEQVAHSHTFNYSANITGGNLNGTGFTFNLLGDPPAVGTSFTVSGEQNCNATPSCAGDLNGKTFMVSNVNGNSITVLYVNAYGDAPNVSNQGTISWSETVNFSTDMALGTNQMDFNADSFSSNLVAGDTVTATDGNQTQTFVIDSFANYGDNNIVTFTSNSNYHFSSSTVWTSSSNTFSNLENRIWLNAILTSGTGNVEVLPHFFSIGTEHPMTVTDMGYCGEGCTTGGVSLGAGATDVPVVIYGTGFWNDDLGFTATTSNSAVTLSDVTYESATELYASASVAAGTAPINNIQVSVSANWMGGATSSSTDHILNTVAGPTITGVTVNSAPVQNGAYSAITITGTGLSGASFAALDATGFWAGQVDDNALINDCSGSSTSVTCRITNDGRTSNTLNLQVTSTNLGMATTTNAPISFAIGTMTVNSPTTINYGYQGTFNVTVTGQGYSAGQTVTDWIGYKVFDQYGNQIGSDHFINATFVTATTATLSGDTFDYPAGDQIVFFANDYTGVTDGVDSSNAVTVVSAPHVTGVSTSGVVQGTTKTVTVYGYNFKPGDTLVCVDNTSGAVVAGVSATVSQLTPSTLTASVTVASSVSNGDCTFYVSGGTTPTSVSEVGLTILNGPGISTVNGSTPGSSYVAPMLLAGKSYTLTIVGTAAVSGTSVGFETGATVSSSNPLVSFGTPVFTLGNTLTVTATVGTLTGATPVMADLTVTNPAGYGSVTLANAMQLDPNPTVNGSYYIAPSTSGYQLTVTGTGFQTGMTVSSTNSDFTVSILNTTASTATLLVTTDAAAVQGTSSVVTFTNPDTGSASFSLYGGVAPVNPHLSKVTGAAHAGTTRYLTVHGTSIPSSKPKITSNAAGAKVTVVWAKWGTAISIKVTTPSTTKAGWHKLTLKWGSVTRTVSYLQN